MKKLPFLACLFFAAACTHSSDYKTTEIVVDFKDDVSSEHIADLEKKLSTHFVPESSYSSVDQVYIAEVSGDEDVAIKVLREDSDVEAVDIDEVMTVPEGESAIEVNSVGSNRFKPNDPLFDHQWNMHQIHLRDAWNGRAGEGVVIAIIDTGSQPLEDMSTSRFVEGYDFVNNRKEVIDDNSHGSHCAGTAGQDTGNNIGVVGVARNAKIMPVKVLSGAGSGTVAAIAEGIHFAVDHHANVISLSLGGGRYNSVMAKAIKNAHDKGVFIAAANGNSSHGEVSYPAKYPGTCAVAATGTNERVTFYSNWGKETCIAAPGGDGDKTPDHGVLQNTIVNGKDGYYSYSGTSMSTPAVAGAAAIVISEGITNPDEVREILVKTARMPIGMKKPPSDFAQRYGAGLLDVDAAVALAHARTNSSTKIIYIAIIALFFIIIIVALKKKR